MLVFASGDSEGGGSGFKKLIEAMHAGTLTAEIVAVVSNHANGGVKKRADELEIPFVHFAPPREAEDYQRLVREYKAEAVALSGWLKLVKGLDPRTTINIHPGPLPEFGGAGLYGHHVHEKVMETFRAGRIKYSEVSMHFVTEKYDDGPVFFRFPVKILDDDTPESLQKRVNAVEHEYQAFITDLVVRNQITWDGKNHGSLKVPMGYKFHLRQW
jgi:phosphoribosylglycinamide formyltransferase-1